MRRGPRRCRGWSARARPPRSCSPASRSSAARAYEIGLVNRVVPAAELHERTQALAERIAANAPLSVAAAKRTVYLSAPAAEADEIWAPVYRSADAQEGPRAFREKRTPVWKGR